MSSGGCFMASRAQKLEWTGTTTLSVGELRRRVGILILETYKFDLESSG